jgi:uncharacterized protein
MMSSEESLVPALDVAEGHVGRVFAIRMPPGTDILRAIEALCHTKKVSSAVIFGGAASLQRIIVRNLRQHPNPWPIKNEHRIFTEVDGPLELLSLAGNVGHLPDGKLFVHCHVVVSSGMPEARTLGGHLVEGAIICSTGEFVLAELDGIDMLRTMNEGTKAYELNPQPRR